VRLNCLQGPPSKHCLWGPGFTDPFFFPVFSHLWLLFGPPRSNSVSPISYMFWGKIFFVYLVQKPVHPPTILESCFPSWFSACLFPPSPSLNRSHVGPPQTVLFGSFFFCVLRKTVRLISQLFCVVSLSSCYPNVVSVFAPSKHRGLSGVFWFFFKPLTAVIGPFALPTPLFHEDSSVTI